MEYKMQIINHFNLIPLQPPYIGFKNDIYFFNLFHINNSSIEELTAISKIINNKPHPILPFCDDIEIINPTDLTIKNGKINLNDVWDILFTSEEPDGSLDTLD